MKWEPSDITRLVGLSGGLVLLCLGAYMMWSGISAEGAIDIKSSVLTGSIKTGSAGLFIAFLAFAIIVFSLSTLGRRAHRTAFTPSDHKKSSQAFRVLMVLLAGLVASSFAAAGGLSGLFFLAAFFGVASLPVGVAYFFFLEDE